MRRSGEVRILCVCGSLQARSANRDALDVVDAAMVDEGARVDRYGGLDKLPPFNPDLDDPGDDVRDWRARIGAADAVVIASPEYAGSFAGVVKNALDWIVGSGELYRKPVGLISAGTSGGHHARRALVQTLTWQGAHVVASLGVDSPRTKSDASGVITDGPTITELRAFSHLVVQTTTNDPPARMELVRTVVTDAGVNPEHIAPPE
ncbi:MAG: NAD(P)H-dependent oxidoreductase [Acidimicrobiia bacterium]